MAFVRDEKRVAEWSMTTIRLVQVSESELADRRWEFAERQLDWLVRRSPKFDTVLVSDGQLRLMQGQRAMVGWVTFEVDDLGWTISRLVFAGESIAPDGRWVDAERPEEVA